MFRRRNVRALTTEIPRIFPESSDTVILILFYYYRYCFRMKDKGNENAMNLIWKQTLFVEHFLIEKKKKRISAGIWFCCSSLEKELKNNNNKAGEQKVEHILHWEPRDYHTDYVISMELPCRWGTDVPSANLPWRQKGAGREGFFWKRRLQDYRPFLNCVKPLFQGETKCKAINTKIILLFSCK